MSTPGGEPSADAALTANRSEAKYLLARASLPAVLVALRRELTLHRFTGQGANLLPEAQQFATSVYFDTPSHTHLRAALSHPEQAVKLRAREYYDLQPTLAELATDASQIVREQSDVWFELKERDHGRSRKLRFRLPKREVRAFFRREHPAFEHSAEGELCAIVAYLRALAEPLLPSCIVNYQRIALQDRAGQLRVTVDLDVGFYAAPGGLWAEPRTLVRGTFGAPVAVERNVLLEVKSHGPAPAWLESLLAAQRARASSYSKFVAAARAVHGD